MPFLAIWTDLEIILSEDREIPYITYVWNIFFLMQKKKMIQMNLFTKQTQKTNQLPKGRDKFGIQD